MSPNSPVDPIGVGGLNQQPVPIQQPVLKGRLESHGPGLAISTRAMTATLHQMAMHTDNVAHYGVPGYHRKDPVITQFVEYLGANAIDETISEEIGRIRRTDNPLDVALNTPGYFQKVDMTNGRIEETRDGRMKLDGEGNLLAIDNKPILSTEGAPIQLPFIPHSIKEDVSITPEGTIKVFNRETGNTLTVATLNVVTPEGTPIKDVDMRQGHVEDSNVFLQNEFSRLLPLRRQFEANRQLFLIQSDNLSRTIQELGRIQ